MAKKGGDNKHNTQHVGDAIQQLLQSYHIKSKFDEAKVIGSWDRLVGKSIAKRTKKVFIRNHVLFVELDSPAMKSDLNFHKTQILALFEKEFGKGTIKEMVIM